VKRKLSGFFRPEFRPLIDEIEPWLERQPPRKWNNFVVYVTDTTLEFERGEAEQKTSARVMPKVEAIEWERRSGAPAIVEKLKCPQSASKVWIIASDAKNNINIVECEIFQLAVGPTGQA